MSDISNGRGDHPETLDAVQRSVLHLMTSAPTRPTLLRVQAGDVMVEVEWVSDRKSVV